MQILYRSGPFLISSTTRTLSRDGQIIPLFPKSFDVLLCLVQNAGRVVGKDELLKAVWPDTFVEESNLSQSISLLRKALEERPGENRYIITVPGRGYQFTAAAELVESGSQAAPELFVQTTQERITAVIEQTEEEEAGFALPASTGKARVLVAAGSVAAAGLLMAAGWFGYQHWHHPAELTGQRELVLADFDNTTGDANFDHALNDALKIDLEQSPYFTFLSRTKVQETLTQMQRSKDAPLTPDVAREVCERNNAQAVLNGSVARFGTKYLITLAATDCDSGNQLLESKRQAGNGDAVPTALDAIAADVRRRLGESRASVQQYSMPLFAANTGSLEALRAYSQAEQLGMQGKYVDAVPLFQRAIELDSKFAIAYAGLASAYTNLGERELEAVNYKKAYELRGNADEQDSLLIIAHYHDDVTGDIYEAIRNYRTWADIYPQNPVPWEEMADEYTQIGQPELAIAPAKRALSLTAENAVGYVILARAELHGGQFDAAKAVCDQAVRQHLDGGDLHSLLIQIAYAQHDQADLDAQIAWAQNNPTGLRVRLNIALIAFAQGQAEKAQQLMQDAADSYRHQGMDGLATSILLATTRDLAEEGALADARKLLDTLPLPPGMTDPVVAMAETGESERAHLILQQDMQQHPTDTLWQYVKGSQIHAAILLAEHKPQDAIVALRPSIPYDLRSFDLPAMRGLSYLAAKQPVAAELEFRKILGHPGVDPISYNYPLAQLGLARADAMQGKTAEARAAYEALFTLWKNADADLPILKQARTEYAALGTSH